MISMNAAFASHIFEGILAALVISLAAGPLAISLARRFKLVDLPGAAPHKKHAVPTPLAGGIILIVALPLAALLFGLWTDGQMRAILLGSFVIFVFGLLDDAVNLRARYKLLGQVLATAVLIFSNVYIQIFQNPSFFVGGSQPVYRYVDYALTLLWVIGITNAFNLVDSMDGLAAGLSGSAFAFFMLAALDSEQFRLSQLGAILFGISITLYFYNAPPARLFLGDSAAQTLGFQLAAMGMLYNPLGKAQTSSWFVPILLVGVPIFDTALVSVSRLRRRRAFYSGGLDHTYHRLVSLGLEPNRAVLAMTLASIILDCLAFVAVSLPPVYANSLFGACLLAGVALVFVLDSRLVRQKDELAGESRA